MEFWALWKFEFERRAACFECRKIYFADFSQRGLEKLLVG
jgi:hypothetical protein